MKKRFGSRRGMLAMLVTAGLGVAAHRAAADAPPGWYDGSVAGTVLDAHTGLTWQKTVPSGTFTWNEATTYCQQNTAGLPGSGWRLPSMKELQTIVDESRVGPAIDPTWFPNTPWQSASDRLWTSTLWFGSSDTAWVVFFGDGLSYNGTVSTGYRVRCVR